MELYLLICTNGNGNELPKIKPFMDEKEAKKTQEYYMNENKYKFCYIETHKI